MAELLSLPKPNPSLISVVIPVYNGELYLAEAIQSVLDQAYQPLEIIVVDDGSTDRSVEIAAGFPHVQVVSQPKAGPGAARNTGVQTATGNWLAFLDADDVWTRQKLIRQLAAFEQDPELDVVFGYVQQFVSPELGDEVRTRLKCPPNPMPGLHPGTMLIKRKSFFQIGLLNSALVLGDFLDWHGRATDAGLKMLMLDEVVMCRRLHTTNLTLREKALQTDYVKMLKSTLDRRRAR
ncbi:MAG TPA: glycosyltransferase family A protein [Acidobacteriota bacterium]|nr:glycosyltransferase family A protein [Acidobacteriota bacterium]HNH84816.1 glycosyltransferase family A protein [Acidobacteriota bacterium]